MTTFSPAELEQVKAAVDILDFAARHVQLRKLAAHEYAGPCPTCGGRDRFHVDTKTQRWMCRSCTGGETWQDVIALRRFVTGETFPAAVQALGGRLDVPVPPVAPRMPDPAAPPKWKTEAWQTKARACAIDAAMALDTDVGASGRAYLAQRGISLETAHFWVLGYAPVSPPWDKAQQRRVGGPSITLPYLRHVDDRIMAVRYRRIHPDEDRYINEPGSTVRLYGLHLLNANASTLIVVEGELNAISIWQAGKGLDCTVVSIGGHSLGELVLSDVGRLAANFGRCLVWCDEPEKSQQLRAALGVPDVQMRRSPVLDGKKIDTNDMLQRGQLGPFLARILEQ